MKNSNEMWKTHTETGCVNEPLNNVNSLEGGGRWFYNDMFVKLPMLQLGVWVITACDQTIPDGLSQACVQRPPLEPKNSGRC
jgi:hypothetical protein